MNKEDSIDSRFIDFLYRFERDNDRGAVAKLRRCLGREETPTPEAMRVLGPFLSEYETKVHDLFLVAALFASHSQLGGKNRGNFGKSFRDVGDHDSAQKRFTALLDSNREDLPHRLRQAVSLAKSKSVPLDWLQLLRDLGNWEHPDRFVQFNWAKGYWGYASSKNSDGVAVNSGKGEEKNVD